MAVDLPSQEEISLEISLESICISTGRRRNPLGQEVQRENPLLPNQLSHKESIRVTWRGIGSNFLNQYSYNTFHSGLLKPYKSSVTGVPYS